MRCVRGERVLLAAVVAVFALVGGCSAAPPPSATGTGTFPVTIEHAFGRTTIPAVPTRVVTLGYTDQDAVLALGVVPVGTSEWYGEQPGALFPWAREKLGDAHLPIVLPSAETVSFERVAALQPDLILGLYGGLTQADYEKLSRIAPTVAQPPGVASYAIPWDVQTEIAGKALGRSAQAAELVAGVRARIAAARAVHPEFTGKKALAGAWFNDRWYAYSSEDQRGRVLTDLGFTVPPEIDALSGTNFGTSISLERPDLLDVDALVWITFTGSEEQLIRKSPGYAASRVNREGRAMFVRSARGGEIDAAMGGFITVLSLPRLLDALPDRLEALVDGR